MTIDLQAEKKIKFVPYKQRYETIVEKLGSSISCEPISLDVNTRILSFNGKGIKLDPSEYTTLDFLIKCWKNESWPNMEEISAQLSYVLNKEIITNPTVFISRLNQYLRTLKTGIVIIKERNTGKIKIIKNDKINI
jgi:DNA-binding response OmpR family regulator